jgi:hypothetical protein
MSYVQSVGIYATFWAIHKENILAWKEMMMDPWLVSFPNRIVLWSMFSQSTQQDSHTTQSSHLKDIQCIILHTRNRRKKLWRSFSVSIFHSRWGCFQKE